MARYMLDTDTCSCIMKRSNDVVLKRYYASICADLKMLGAMIGANDLFIAAHARSLGLTLVTNNMREFGRVPKLAIENWTFVR
jgi:tRNA(fMet)-specific endonuclease VapC